MDFNRRMVHYKCSSVKLVSIEKMGVSRRKYKLCHS
jgi:hypothetical protein